MASDQVISDRLNFLRVDGGTRAVLSEFLPAVRREMPGILTAFYQHIRQWPKFAGVFKVPAAFDRASKAQGER